MSDDIDSDVRAFYERGRAGEARGVWDAATVAIRTGFFAGTTQSLFTTAYFHLPEELLDEVAAAGLTDARLFNVEGPGAFAADVDERWGDGPRRQALRDAARLIEDDPRLLTASSHLLVVARTPPQDPPRRDDG